jgi:peptide/nickel transport system substrate-binding protein
MKRLLLTSLTVACIVMMVVIDYNDLTPRTTFTAASMALAATTASTTATPTKTTPALTPQRGGTLRIAIDSNPTYFGAPWKWNSPKIYTAACPAIESLTRTDSQGNAGVPWLVTKYTANSKGPNYVFTLRKGVRFHDGTDFDAWAVKWNWDKMIASNTPNLDRVRSVDVIDKYTVRINLNQWDNILVSNFSTQLGRMVSPTAYKTKGEQWVLQHPIGTGPFKFVSWETDKKVVFERNDDYWQKDKPYLDRIEMIIIPDNLTRQLALKAGEVDVAWYLDSKDWKPLEQSGLNVHRCFQYVPGAQGLVPDSTNSKSPFADVRIRQAVQYGIDQNALIQAALRGEATATNQYSPKGAWSYNPSVVGYPFNPAKAKQILAEAGYPNGFKTKLFYPASSQNDIVYTAVQGMLSNIGITVDLQPRIPSVIQEMGQSGGGWEGLIFNSQSARVDVTAPLADMYSGDPRYYNKMIVPADYKRAIDNALSAVDKATKQKWIWETQKLLVDKYCLQIFLYVPVQSVVSLPNVHDTGMLSGPGSSHWYTPEVAWKSAK